MTTHTLKVIPPYFEALADRSKTFEVRRNDRAFQRGDELHLVEWHPARLGDDRCHECRNRGHAEHAPLSGRTIVAEVAFVYSGDPRFGGLEPGYVVLGLK